jgi:hypothetical protein
MPRKKKTSATAAAPAANLATLKIGSRVRCTDDGVTGRIVWANAVSVKIRWDDGEQVTWRRDSLAGRPIAIVDAEDQPDRSAAPPDPVDTEYSQPTTGRAAKRKRTPTAAAAPAVEALCPPVGPAAPPTGAGSGGLPKRPTPSRCFGTMSSARSPLRTSSRWQLGDAVKQHITDTLAAQKRGRGQMH